MNAQQIMWLVAYGMLGLALVTAVTAVCLLLLYFWGSHRD